MGDFPHMGGFSTNDSEIDLETNKICSNFFKNYSSLKKENSRLSIKVKNFENSVNFLKEENFKLSLKNENLEKEICFMKQNLSESEEKFKIQRADFMEKLSISQSKFLSCDKTRKDLENKIVVLTSELEKYKNVSKQFTNGSQGLDKLLGIGKSSRDRSGLGFDKGSNVASSSKTTFVKPTNHVEKSPILQKKVILKDQNFQKSKPSVCENDKNKFSSPRTSNKKFIPICHHCGIVGHIRPNCFKLLDGTSSFKTNVEKSNFFAKKSLISNKNLNSKETNFSKSKFKTFANNRDKSTRFCSSHNKFIPTCHHCGVVGHIRPKCQKFSKEKSYFGNNLFKKFDVLVNEISKLRNGKYRRPTFNLVDSKINSGRNVWVKKGELKDSCSPKVFDFSKIKILKRPSEANNLN